MSTNQGPDGMRLRVEELEEKISVPFEAERKRWLWKMMVLLFPWVMVRRLERAMQLQTHRLQMFGEDMAKAQNALSVGQRDSGACVRGAG